MSGFEEELQRLRKRYDALQQEMFELAAIVLDKDDALRGLRSENDALQLEITRLRSFIEGTGA
jgi:chromosome segregation ATPase